MRYKDEIEAGQRVAFGNNWSRFLGVLDESRIQAPENSLRAMLKVKALAGRHFLDIGSECWRSWTRYSRLWVVGVKVVLSYDRD